MIDGEPFRAHEARRRIRLILSTGSVNYDIPHFQQEAAKDSVEMTDVVNVLRGGTVEDPEWENGEWRYRVRTGKFSVIIAFSDEDELTIVTVWRLKQ